MLCISAFAQRLTVATVENGSITATPTTPSVGDVVTLTATPNTNCVFVTWYVHKTGDPNTVTTVVANAFRMPNYDVTVSGVFATTTNTTNTIGSGNNTHQYLPTYGSYQYSLTQQIYTADEVGVAGTISAIAYKVNSNAGRRNLDIYIKPTRKTSFNGTTGGGLFSQGTTDWETMSDLYKVFSGNVTFITTDWTTITLDRPFEYDGINGIIVCVVDKTGSSTSSSASPTFMAYSTSANRAMYAYRNSGVYEVGYSSTIQGYRATTSTSNNQMKLTKVIKNAQTMNLSPDAIEGFSYVYEHGPSGIEVIDVLGADLDNDISVTAPTGYEVSTSANGTYSESLTIPRASSKGGRGTTNWNFEGSFLNWTTIDKDGDKRNWMVSSNLMSNFNSGHNGGNALSSESYHRYNNNSGTPLNPDNWLISPQVTLGGTFTMWACAQDATWAAEHFGIYVSTTSNTNTDSFTLLNEWTLSAHGGRDRGERGTRDMGDWCQYSVDLSMYAGQTGYIAIRHFDCTDMFYLNVDDFTLDTEATYVPNLPVDLTKATVYLRLRADLEPNTYNGDLTLTSGSKNATVSLEGEVYASDSQYTITTNVSPVDAGTVTGGGTYYDGSIRTLTATPSHLYNFTRWEKDGSIVSIANPYEITVTGDATYTAVFTEKEAYNITLHQTAGGTISADMDRACSGDVVTLSRTVAENYFFGGWSVMDATHNIIEVSSNQFIMPENDVTVTASFRSSFTISVTQSDHGSVHIVNDITEACPGQNVGLEAIPDEGCMLLTWYVYRTGNPRDVVATINNNCFQMLAMDVSVMAVFVTTSEYMAQLGEGEDESRYMPTYVRNNYSLSQQICTADEMDHTRGYIHSIAYRATTAESTRNLIIYMVHTDKTVFSSKTDWVPMHNEAKVFQGEVTFGTSDWTTITLDTPFDYDGNRNFIVCIVDVTGSKSGTDNKFTKFYCYNETESTYRGLFIHGDDTNYADKVLITSAVAALSGQDTPYINRMNFTMTVPGSAESISLAPHSMEAFSYVEGLGPSNTDRLDIIGVDLGDDLIITAPDNYEISMTENGYYSPSITIPLETSNKGNRDMTLWKFDGSMEEWTTLDADGDDYNWVLGSRCGGVYLAEGESITEGQNSSTDMVVSGSYTNAGSTALTPDNWLISPQVSLNGAFSLWAQPYNPNYPADHFGIYVSTTGTNPSDFTMLNEWTMSNAAWKNYSVDLSLYEGQTGYIAVRHFNCTDQFIIKLDEFELNTSGTITLELPVTITSATVYVRLRDNLTYGNYDGILRGISGRGANDTVSLHGVVMANYNVTVNPNNIEYGAVRGTGTFNAGSTVTVRAAAYEGYRFVNWTEDDVEVSTDETYSFVITSDRDLIANFEAETITQVLDLYQGINWCSLYVVVTLDELKTAIAEALGRNETAIIKSRMGSINYRNGQWRGSGITSLDQTQMYMIKTSKDCQIELTGLQVDVSTLVVTIHEGINWIAYPYIESMPVTSCFAGFEAVNGDILKGRDFSTNHRNGQWRGQLKTLEPGKGYIFKSQTAVERVFMYPTISK